jgi:hypothetical protein
MRALLHGQEELPDLARVAAVRVDDAIHDRRSLNRDAKNVLDHRRDLPRRVELIVRGASDLGSRPAR